MPILLDTLNLKTAERLCVTSAMNRAGGCKSDAAGVLGISRSALDRLLAKHKIVQRHSVWAQESPCT